MNELPEKTKNGAGVDSTSHWNQEPLDHTRYQGGGRAEFGCPVSRAETFKGSEVCIELIEFCAWGDAIILFTIICKNLSSAHIEPRKIVHGTLANIVMELQVGFV